MQEAGNWKPVNSKAIVSNISQVFETQDITKLNKPTYQFVANLSGFIAHYDLYGFQSNYEDLRSFSDDLLPACSESEARRLGEDLDFIKWYGKSYCKSEADALNGIREVVTKYQSKVANSFESEDARKLQKIIDLATEVQHRNDPGLTRSFLAGLL